MIMDVETFRSFWPLLVEGAFNTLWLTVATLILGFIIAFPVALCRNSGHWLASGFAIGFVFVFRGAPLLALLFMIYYGAPDIALIRDTFLWSFFKEPIACAVLALSLNSAGYLSEIIAGALRAVPKGEIEAGKALGLHPLHIFRFIKVPNAVRASLRSYGNEVIFVLKGTSAASMVTVADVMSAANQMYFNTFDPITPMLAAAALYLSFVVVLIACLRIVERRVQLVER
jgi:putative lysine/arginine/ornithine/histidine/octopine transport system permease protein